MARPFKPYFAPWLNKTIDGLYRGKDGRWRITATGERFREPDERLAVARFLATQKTTFITMAPKEIKAEDAIKEAMGEQYGKRRITIKIPHDPREPVTIARRIPEQEFWNTMRRLLIEDPDLCARMTGIPQLKNIAMMDIPKPALSLQKLLDLYVEKNESVGRTKGQVKSAWQRLTEITRATHIDDLTTKALMDFREKMIRSNLAATGVAQVFAKIKQVFSFALKYGEDPTQLTAVIGRMKVLYAPKSDSRPEPNPISRDAFHKLLAAADEEWRLMLLLGLNCAFYIEDLCVLKWDELDLNAGTFKGIRNKTKVARVAVLWPETLEALKEWPHRGKSPYVFTSQTGTRFNGASRYDTYKSLRDRTGVDYPFSALRDGAYTTAVQNCEERYARVLAGHRSPGLQDSYVLRNPQFVKPATDAVYAYFFAPAPCQGMATHT